MKIGYIGLGAMGGALARRLLKSHPLRVWDLNPAAVERIARQGAIPATSPSGLARECDLVLTCLPRSSDVHELLFGTGRLAESLSPGKTVIDQTSGNPEETARMAGQLAAQGAVLMDAPVSGGQRGAEAGTIAIMVAGPQAAYQQVLPILEAISPNVEYCGQRVGDAHALKLVNNTLSGSARLATIELVALGRRAGLTLAEITQAINQGDGRNRTSSISLPALLQGRPAVSDFALALLVKDLNLGTSLGMACAAPMLIANLVRSYHEMALNMLGRTAQLEQLIGVVERMAGTSLADASPPDQGTGAGTDNGGVAALLGTAVATCNLLITYECVALGAKYGLPLDLMSRVLLKGGAWNAAAERALPALSSGKPLGAGRLDDRLEDLKRVADLARTCGAPILVADLVRGLVEAGHNQFGGEADIGMLSRLSENLAGTRISPSPS